MSVCVTRMPEHSESKDIEEDGKSDNDDEEDGKSDNDDEEDVLPCEISGIILYSIYLELVYI